MHFTSTKDLIHDAVSRRVVPCAAYAVGRGNDIYVRESVGSSSLFPREEPLREDTIFDMASLTKVLATTMVALRFLEEGRLLLTDPLSRFFTPEELLGIPEGRAEANIFHLMTHTSGITPHIALWREIPDYAVGSGDFDSAVARTILRSAPFCKVGEQVYYSCMGYILLQKILERISGKPLDKLAEDYVFAPLGMNATGYLPYGDNRNKPDCNAAATEFSSIHQYYIRGHVHDENAHFLGGVSGNAGVFSNLSDMITFAQMLSLRGEMPSSVGSGRYLSRRMFDLTVQDHTPGLNESRGLGLQLRPPLPALSAAGDLFAYGSYGHTGFTGTSLYVDAGTGVWAVLLTNAVHLGRDKTEFFRVRRLFHNTVMAELN